MKVALIFLGGSSTQNVCFWPSYKRCNAGYDHDFILVHRNFIGVEQSSLGIPQNIFIENKLDKHGNDVPHRAFGGYRHYYKKYKGKYDLFVFISDDVVIRRDNWLRDIVSVLGNNNKLGFGASQIFHEQVGSYPSHLRAPFWFAKDEALSKAKWEFNSDHVGEVSIGDQLTATGFFGVQIGSKLDLAYDSLDLNSTHITCILENKFFNYKNYTDKFTDDEFLIFERLVDNMSISDIKNMEIVSPLPNVKRPQNCFFDLEPFDGLIYRPSYHIAEANANVKEILSGIYIYEKNSD